MAVILPLTHWGDHGDATKILSLFDIRQMNFDRRHGDGRDRIAQRVAVVSVGSGIEHDPGGPLALLSLWTALIALLLTGCAEPPKATIVANELPFEQAVALEPKNAAFLDSLELDGEPVTDPPVEISYLFANRPTPGH